MKPYEEYRRERQEAVDALPLHWAFGPEQFDRLCKELDATTEDFVHVNGIGALVLKEEWPEVNAFFEKPDELPGLMRDYGFAKGAFVYEMRNHEYAYAWDGDWDVCRCFGHVEGDDPAKYFDQLGWEPQTRKAYKDARKEYYRLCDENGWW